MDQEQILNLSGLTEEQTKAIELWKIKSKDRMFLGTSAKQLAEGFARANILKTTDPQKGDAYEQSLFAICRMETPLAN